VRRIDRIARRVATAEVVTASFFLAKDRPSDLFAGTFFDIREKAKQLKNQWEDEAAANIEKTLLADLSQAGISVIDFKISLGQYRGSRFVTSAKLNANTGTRENAEKLLAHLQAKYSPKFKLKNFSETDGSAEYNVR
jgi:hypothetical protein